MQIGGIKGWVFSWIYGAVGNITFKGIFQTYFKAYIVFVKIPFVAILIFSYMKIN